MFLNLSHFPNPYPFPIGFQRHGVKVRNFLQKLLLGSSPSPSLRTRSWLYSVSVAKRTRTWRTIRTPPKYIREECISGPKYCKATFLANIKIKLWWGWTPKSWLLKGRCSVHPYLYKDKFKFEVIVIGKFQNRGEFLIVMWALKTASWSEQLLCIQLSPNCEEVRGVKI